MNTRTITAQVAAEAIVNEPGGYDAATIAAVRDEAIAAGVAPLYVDLLVPLPTPACAHEPNGWDCSRYIGCPAW